MRVLEFTVSDPPPQSARPHSPAEFLTTLRWKKSTPELLAQSAAEGDIESFSRELASALAAVRCKRRQTLRLVRIDMAGLTSAPDNAITELTRAGLEAVEHSDEKEIPNITAALLDAAEEATALSPCQFSAWMTLLPVVADQAPGIDLVRFWIRLLSTADVLADTDPEAEELDATSEDWFAPSLSELLFRAALVAPDLKSARRWKRRGRKGLRELLHSATDDEGFPRAALIPNLGGWLPTLARSTVVAYRNDTRLFRGADWQRVDRAIAATAAMISGQGTIADCDAPAEVLVNSLDVLSRLRMDSRHPARQLIRQLSRTLTEEHSASTNGKPASKPKKKRNHAVEPGWQSDEASVALLRRTWDPASAIARVTHEGPEMSLAVQLNGGELFAGEWESELTIEGQLATPAQDWNCDCWFSDADVDFAEFSQVFEEAATFSRQILLSRRERFLVFTEAVRGGAPRRIDLETRLPIVSSLRSEQDSFTRETQWVTPVGRVRVLPATLPFPRSEASEGRFVSNGTELHWSCSGIGCVAQVIVIDWSDVDGEEPVHWTRLTVAEEGRALAGNEAMAARWQLGSRQYAILLNLTRSERPRSFLGHHTENETVIGSFTSDGEIEPLVHVTFS